jgi:hypothetical protein
MTGPWPLPSQVAFAQSPCFRIEGIHTNRFGMRDRERQLTSSRPRIALVGDSFIEGLQVADDEIVSRRLEALLADRAEVLNFGVSSAGTSVEFLNYRARVRQFHPDVVLLMFFVGNDAEDNVPALKQQRDPAMAAISPYLTLDEHGQLRDAPQPGIARRTSWLVTTASRLRVGQWAYRGVIGLRRTMSRAPDTADPPHPEQQAWRITEQVLVRFHHEVRDSGSQFALAIVPDYDTPVSNIRRKQLLQLAARDGFPVVDLTPVFASVIASRGTDRFFHACDGHWTAAGHATAAEALRDFVEREQWLGHQLSSTRQ